MPYTTNFDGRRAGGASPCGVSTQFADAGRDGLRGGGTVGHVEGQYAGFAPKRTHLCGDGFRLVHAAAAMHDQIEAILRQRQRHGAPDASAPPGDLDRCLSPHCGVLSR